MSITTPRRRSGHAAAAVLALTGPLVVASPVSAGEAVQTHTVDHTITVGQDHGVTDNLTPVELTTGPASLYPWPGQATFTDLTGRITDVDVTLSGLTHGRLQDLDVLLVNHRTGRGAVILSDAGGNNEPAGATFTLDDEAPLALPSDFPIQNGESYRPRNVGSSDAFPAPAPAPTSTSGSLSAFDGTRANGQWALYVVDDETGVPGRIDSWSIDIETTGPGPYPSTLEVTGGAHVIDDLDVTLHGITHQDLGNLDVMLVGPQGSQATVLSDVEAPDYAVDGITVTLDDEAAGPAEEIATSGTWRPTNHGGTDPFPPPAPGSGSAVLSVFDGTDPRGTWRLYVVDDAAGEGGRIDGWSITVRGQDEIAPRVVSTTPADGATGVARGVSARASFSEAVKPATLTDATVYLTRRGSTRHVPARLRYDAESRTVVLDPRERLASGRTYVARVTSGVRDLAGNPLSQDLIRTVVDGKAWRFTTR